MPRGEEELTAARDRVIAAAQVWRAECQFWTAADGRTCDGCWYGRGTVDRKLRELCMALGEFERRG